MIDPIFSKRLQNWSRCIRARRKSLPSPTAQVLNELRLKYGPPAIEEYRNEPPISSADMADAEKLSAAYGGPWLTPQEKRVLQMIRNGCTCHTKVRTNLSSGHTTIPQHHKNLSSYRV